MGATALRLLLEASCCPASGFDVVAAVTRPPAGRKKLPSPVHALAEARGIETLTPPTAKDPAFLERMGALDADLYVTAAYGCYLPRALLRLPRFGTLNIHPSLLPLYRGASPVQRSLEAGDAATGVSVLFSVAKMDAGPVLRQTVRALGGDERAPDLLEELFATGVADLVDALPGVWEGKVEKEAVAQDDEVATHAPLIDRDERWTCLATSSAAAVHNKVRRCVVYVCVWSVCRCGWRGGGSKGLANMIVIKHIEDDGIAPGLMAGVCRQVIGKERREMLKVMVCTL